MNKQNAPGGIEVWRDIPGYEGLYQVSDHGHVMRIAGSAKCLSNRLLNPSLRSNGYVSVALSKNGSVQQIDIHRLVAWAFIGEQGVLWVNHKNGLKDDNRLINLEYVTPSENAFHAYQTGLQPSRKGEGNGKAKLTEEDVRLIRWTAEMCIEDVGGRRGLAELFNVSKTTIIEIINGKIWGHI